MVILHCCGLTVLKSSCAVAGELYRQPWWYRNYWICIALDGSAVTFRLSFYITLRRHWIFIVIDGTAASFQLNLYSTWRRYLNFYRSGCRCGIPLPLLAFIAVVVTCVNGLVYVYPISICWLGLFDMHIIWIFASSSSMLFLSTHIICIFMS